MPPTPRSCPRARPRACRRLAATALALTAALVTLTATTSASAAGSITTSANSASAADSSKQLDIRMQAQQQSNWCWAASGNTIATWFGRSYSQNQFCDAAFNRPQGSACGNWQASLADVQTALDWAGINSGSYVSGTLDYGTVENEISADRPVETRIEWSSGGGHMHVLYGYDATSNWLYWGDPWPSNNRYNWADYNYYVSNDSFSWTHSLYGIGA